MRGSAAAASGGDGARVGSLVGRCTFNGHFTKLKKSCPGTEKRDAKKSLPRMYGGGVLVHVLSIVVYTQSTQGTIYFVHDIVEHPRIRLKISIYIVY